MKKLPVRKQIRLKEYDYSAPGAYFVTFCTANRKPILWKNRSRGAYYAPENTLSEIGEIVDDAIDNISVRYPAVSVDKYCIMPDHVHLLLSIKCDDDGRVIPAPTISNVVLQLKSYVTKNVGKSIWQRSFVDRVIRNQKGYEQVW